jgi:hypothetical protein
MENMWEQVENMMRTPKKKSTSPHPSPKGKKMNPLE